METFKHKSDIVSMVGMLGIIIILNIVRYLNGYGISLPILGLTVLLAIMVFWMWLVSSYTIESKTLTIKNGPFSQRVAVSEITKLQSGKASIFRGKLSKYKLTIFYKKKRLNVFPEDKKAFVKALLKVNGNIKVE